MSRLAIIRRFRADTPEHLAEDCARLVSELEGELTDVRAKTKARWSRMRDTVTPATPTVRAKLGEILRIDTTAGDVSFYLPQVTQVDLFREVALIKRAAANTVTVLTAGGALVHEGTSLAITTAGVHVLIWDGSSWWRQRG